MTLFERNEPSVPRPRIRRCRFPEGGKSTQSQKEQPSRKAKPTKNPAKRPAKKLAKQKNELSRIDAPILTVEGVANLLHCSVQAVRNTPEDVLPRYMGAGRRLLFLKEDVTLYLRRTIKTNPALDEIVRGIENGPIESSSDSG